MSRFTSVFPLSVSSAATAARTRRIIVTFSALLIGCAAAATTAQAGVWRLLGAEEYRSAPYNRPGSGRFADADPYCRGHVVEIGGGRDNQSFLVRELIPGNCHNRNGARGLAEVKHEWSAPPATLVPQQAVPIRLRSTVSALQNFNPVDGTLAAGFVPYGSRNEYGEVGGNALDPHMLVAASYVNGVAGSSATDDGLRTAQRPEPLRVPEAPWLGSEHNGGRISLRLYTWHGSGIWASVDYVYRWDASGSAASAGPLGPLGPAAGVQGAGTGVGLDLGRVWVQSENGWSGTWTRRGDSATFDAVWTKGGERVTAVLTITAVNGREVRIRRRDTSGSNFEIEYVGLVDNQGNVQGVGHIVGHDVRYNWSATIRRDAIR